MPSQWAHSLFWAGGAEPPPPVGAGGYSKWQLIPIMGGAPEPLARQRTWLARQWKGLYRLWRQVGRYLPERLWLAAQILRVLFSPAYSEARWAVRFVATNGHPRGEELAKYLYHRASVLGSHRYAENIFRRSEASDYVSARLLTRGKKTFSWRQGAALELAYLAYRERGR